MMVLYKSRARSLQNRAQSRALSFQDPAPSRTPDFAKSGARLSQSWAPDFTLELEQMAPDFASDFEGFAPDFYIKHNMNTDVPPDLAADFSPTMLLSPRLDIFAFVAQAVHSARAITLGFAKPQMARRRSWRS